MKINRTAHLRKFCLCLSVHTIQFDFYHKDNHYKNQCLKVLKYFRRANLQLLPRNLCSQSMYCYSIYFSLPAAMVQSLLTEFLKITMDISPDAAKYTDLHFDVLSEEAAFAAQLYHRWYGHFFSQHNITLFTSTF